MKTLWLACFCFCSRSLYAQDDGINDALDEALGIEIAADDCNLFSGEGHNGQNPSLLQTSASYQRAWQLELEQREFWLLEQEASKISEKTIEAPPSFFQTGLDEGEANAAAEFGQVHMSDGSLVEDSHSSLGEVHASPTDISKNAASGHFTEVVRTASVPHQDAEEVVVTDVLSSKPANYDLGALAGYMLDHPHLIIVALIAVPLLGTLVGLALVWLYPARRSELSGLPNLCCSVLQQGPSQLKLAAHVENAEKGVWSKEDLNKEEVCQEVAMPGESHTRSETTANSAKRFRHQLRAVLAEATTLTADNIQELLPAGGGYDTAFSKPVSSGRPVLLRARIEGPLAGGPGPLGLAEAPLTKRSCVYYHSSASQSEEAVDLPQRQEAQEGVEFQVSLLGAPQIRVDVRGLELKLVDMCEGHYTTTQPFQCVPEHWQAFLLDEKTKSYATLPAEQQQRMKLRQRMAGKPVEFQESVLLVGSQISLVGELLRDASGRLSLQPWQCPQTSAQAEERWRTSWECEGSDFSVVIASDDPSFSLGSVDESLQDRSTSHQDSSSWDVVDRLTDLVSSDPYLEGPLLIHC